nr:immunoglobulin light chain junction region [Macaca mulatta]MOV77123.1 immunoglobulin light chain junction region [Macaca mulatta]
CMQSQEFPFTF